MKFRCFIFLFIAGFCCFTYTRAGTIDLNFQPATTFRNGKAGISAKITNRGTIPAQHIQLEAILAGDSAFNQQHSLLESKETFSTTIELGTPPEPDGIYTIVIKTRYSDPNGYPLSTLKTVPLVTDMPLFAEPPIKATLKASDLLRKNGKLILKIKSHYDMALEVNASLFTTDELNCQNPTQSLTIRPKESTEVCFDVADHKTRPGMSYSVIAVINTQIDGLHYSIPVRGTISTLSLDSLIKKYRLGALAAIILAIVLIIIFQFKRTPAESNSRQTVFDIAVLGILMAFTLFHIDPHLLLLNTVTTGGDTPAHNYLASHLANQLLTHGRIISWAGGWWCGFPMFQFYFPLPYLLPGIFDIVLPFNIAFKLVTVSGILLLPACIYIAVRIIRAPRPIPILSAIMIIPMLFDSFHTMWGVNINSTLAGMIASSISFPLMILFIASAARDADEGIFRLRTVLLLIATLSSHFFTSIMACIAVAAIPLFRPKAGFVRAVKTLAIEAIPGLLIMGWWIIPLFLKQEYTVDFGANWTVYFWKQVPEIFWYTTPFALFAIGTAFARRLLIVPVALSMLVFSLLLFFFGHEHVSEVFVNVRLWPFIELSFLLLVATGVGLVIRLLKFKEAAIAAVLIAVLAFGVEYPNTIRSWSKWNYSGMERTPNWQVIKDLVLPLDGTPGRLANDLHETYSSLGSSRIFESVPFLIKKPILEGGILSSAPTSFYSYYIQSETSRCSAGFPNRVKPTTFNFKNATKHLELFNVKHFVARYGKTQQALNASKAWKFLAESKGWQLFELVSHSGSHVFVPKYHPQPIVTDDWKQAGLDWIYTIKTLDQPFVLLSEKEKSEFEHGKIWTDDEFHEYLKNISNGSISNIMPSRLIKEIVVISEEKITDNRISFHTTKPGLPHIIKCSYYPNWKSRDSTKIYKITPNFMLVYPESEDVELYYGYTIADKAGMAVSIIGIAALLAIVWMNKSCKHN